jgi:hypothetical protein
MSTTQTTQLFSDAQLFANNELGFKTDLTFREWDQLFTIRKAGQSKVIGYITGCDLDTFEIVFIK